MDLSRIRIPSPFNRAWYRYAVLAHLGIVAMIYLVGAFGMYHSWELNLLVVNGGVCVLGLLGALLLFSDDKPGWAFWYVGLVVFIVIWSLTQLAVHPYTSLGPAMNNFPL